MSLQCLLVRAGAAAREDVVLELVHHFVREHVLEAAEVAGEAEGSGDDAAISVTPPVPSPRSPVTLFCPKSARDEKRMIGFFSRNWWPRTRESRAYERSAIRAASVTAACSSG